MRATMAHKKGNNEEALDLYMQLLDSSHITIRSFANLSIAGLLVDRGDIESACEFLTNVINIPELRLDSTERCEALELRAQLKEELGKWKESLEDYLALRDLKRFASSTTTVFDDYDEEITRLRKELDEEHSSSE
jgi:tetratricopeptide (TPR) repeat protein